MRRSWPLYALLGVLTCCGRAALAQDQDVLPPEQVFRYSVDADADQVHLRFDIRDGYYLYRERFGFDSGTPDVAVRPAIFPKGEIHKDEYFGAQEIYRGKFVVSLPYTRTGNAKELQLKLKLQGCADFGLCYPPQDWTARVALPTGPAAAIAALLRQDAPAAAPGSDELLPADQAFVMNARFDRPNELTVGWQIAPSYYLYRDKLTFSVDGKIELGHPRLPPGKPHTDESFGTVDVYHDYVEAVIPFSRAGPNAMTVTVKGGYQGCKEGSVCYPPGEQTMTMVLPATSEFPAAAAPPAPGTAGPTAAAATPSTPASEQDQWAARIVKGSWWALLGGFYLAGLALSLTPCVLPMVPILSSIIAGQGAASTGRGFLLSVSYVLGMAVTYTGAGALAALAGSQVQAMFQKPWIITLFAGLFVVLALGMFGLFELQMPTAVQTRLASLANRQRGGTFVGTAVIGALTALIVTTCVAPPLVGALAVIGQTGDITRGAAALFALSIGMGSPLLLVGASAGHVLPKVGPWMNTVKAAFGVMMLGIAVWMLQRILPGAAALALWALLVFLTGVFLGAFDPLPENPRPVRRLSKGLGVLACLYGALLLVGATLGGGDPLQPIPRTVFAAGGAMGAAAPQLKFRSIESVAELQSALGEARAAHQPVMLDFTADWCVSCREMEKYTFPDNGVMGALRPFMLLRADVTANNDDDQALLKYFHSFGPPTIAFFDAGGEQQEGFKLVGYVPPREFQAHVERLAAL